MNAAISPIRGRPGRLFVDYARAAAEVAENGGPELAREIRRRGRRFAVKLLVDRFGPEAFLRHARRINLILATIEARHAS